MTNTDNPWDMLWAIQKNQKCFWTNKWDHLTNDWVKRLYTEDDINDMELCEVSEMLDYDPDLENG